MPYASQNIFLFAWNSISTFSTLLHPGFSSLMLARLSVSGHSLTPPSLGHLEMGLKIHPSVPCLQAIPQLSSEGCSEAVPLVLGTTPAPLTGQQQTDWPWKMVVLLLFLNGKTGELKEFYANNCPCAWMHLWYSALLFMLNSMNNVFLSLHLSWVPLLYWPFYLFQLRHSLPSAATF